MSTFNELLISTGTLLDSGALVSFHDAHRLVRAAVRLGEPRNAVLLGFITLHDEQSTDGAKEIFARYLTSAGARLRAQSELADREIVLRDHEKIARCAPGTALTLALEERRNAGMRWALQKLTGPGEVDRLANREEAAPRARFSVRCTEPGRIDLTLREEDQVGSRLSHAASQRPRSETRVMCLTVIVDG
ncbi:MAG: hypothetical protein AAFX94_18970 [Myxococcota bacterium]